MAISASVKAKNRIFRSNSPKSLFESAKNVLGSTSTFNQGDLMCFDTTTKVIRAVTATTDAANCLGIADCTAVQGKKKSPYQGTAVDAAQAIEDLKGPVYGVTAKMVLKTGDAFAPGDEVYLADGQDCQTVSSVDPGDGNYIGIYLGASLTAAAGAEGDVAILARYKLSGSDF